MRGMGWMVVFAFLAACAPDREFETIEQDSQSVYSYPGCASGELVCPQDVTLMCAVYDLQSQHAGCQVDADCTLVTLPTSCYSTGDCPPIAVAVEQASAFEQEATLEINAYCEAAQCEGPTTCNLGSASVRAACVDGACVSEIEEAP